MTSASIKTFSILSTLKICQKILTLRKEIVDLDQVFDPIISDHQWRSNITLPGGRKGLTKVVSTLGNRLKNYQENKDIVERKATSYLSAYLKFGICSIREAFFIIHNELGRGSPIVTAIILERFLYIPRISLSTCIC